MKKKKRIKSKKISYQDLTYRYKLLSELMNRIPDVIYFKDKKGKLLMVNHAHARGLGLKPEQVIGKTDFDFFPKKRAKLMMKDDEYVLKKGKAIIDKVERATRADGIDNYVSTTKIPRYDDKGKIVGLIGITRDITHRMQLDSLRKEKTHIQKKLDVLEDLSKMQSEFVSVVSHELRTPLAIIKEAVMLIFDGITGPVNDKQKGLLMKAKNNTERLGNIIEELLDISRIERGKLKLHYSLVNLNDLLLDSSDFFKKTAQEKGINLEYFLPRKQNNIFIDAGRINQVASNLISNAIKFTEQNGTIKVDVEILESKIRIGIIDTGVGISKQDLSRLFDKFIQVSKSNSAQRKGVGLGLSIAKELVGRHGGEIWVESRLGVGSKFYFTLPRFYMAEALNKEIRDKINNLLYQDAPVYLINFLIINFREFKKRTSFNPKDLFVDLKEIIDSTLKEFTKSGKKKPEIFLEDYQIGEWSILFHELKENEVNKICNLLKNRMKKYFLENKVKDVFINLGILLYSHKAQDHVAKEVFANIHIKKIYIGSEIRRFERISYKTNIKVLLSDDEPELSQSVDISEGGICFISKRRFGTDANVKIRLKVPKFKQALNLKARVAWRKNIYKEISKEADRKYKIGLEFLNLKDKERKALSKLIKSIS